jgi:pimeloyl-ACP methyl ester carboxylesterase
MRPAMEHPQLAGHLRTIAAENGKYWMGILKHGDFERVLSPPAVERTADLRVPTLLIVGTRDTGDILAIADTLAATVRELRRVTFDGAGHMVNMEQPQHFTEIVQAFLRE